MSQVSQTAQMDFIELFPCEGKGKWFGICGHVLQMGRGLPNVQTGCSSSSKGSAD